MCGYFCIQFINFKLANEQLTDFTNFFSPYDFGKKWQYNLELFGEWMKVILFNAINIIETIDRTNLTDQTKFRLSEITKIENYFNHEIKKWKLNNKKLSKYVACFWLQR